MNFKQYLLNEQQFAFNKLSDIIPLIKRDCSEFLSMTNVPLYRGIRDKEDNFNFNLMPNFRFPTDSSNSLTFILNSAMEIKTGTSNIRNKCFFGSGSGSYAKQYGKLHYVFPTNGFKYLYALDIKDPFIKSSTIIDDVLIITLQHNPEYSTDQIGRIIKIMSEFNESWGKINSSHQLQNRLIYECDVVGIKIPDVTSLLEAIRIAFKDLSSRYDNKSLKLGLGSGVEIVVYGENKGYYGILAKDISYATILRELRND